MSNSNTKQLYTFIDSNIFLSFYDFHHEDLEKLAQLIDLVAKGQIKLFITKQVRREVYRHRETRLAKAYEKFREAKVTLEMPVVCQAYSEYSEIKKAQRKLATIKSELSKKLWADITSRSLEADKIIERLFSAADEIDSDSALERAKIRYSLGNPPGKKDGLYGDEINWESLLEFIPTDNHFVLITDDKDFKSPLNENELRGFLLQEWETTKGSKIIFYRSLTSFFKDHEIDIELRWEEEKDKLIQELMDSPNFATTHEIIRKLSKFISFSEQQVWNIGRAANLNSQVAWIAQDPDVKQFYEKYVLSHPGIFAEDEWDKLQKAFTPIEEDSNEIPF